MGSIGTLGTKAMAHWVGVQWHAVRAWVDECIPDNHGFATHLRAHVVITQDENSEGAETQFEACNSYFRQSLFRNSNDILIPRDVLLNWRLAPSLAAFSTSQQHSKFDEVNHSIAMAKAGAVAVINPDYSKDVDFDELAMLNSEFNDCLKTNKGRFDWKDGEHLRYVKTRFPRFYLPLFLLSFDQSCLLIHSVNFLSSISPFHY